MHHKSKGVPRLPRRIFEWYCGSDLAEDLLGDIEEMYFTNLKNMSGFRAKKKYWQQTFSLLFSYAVRSRRSQTQNSSLPFYNIGLFKNYTKMALRNLARQKAFSLINVICLAVGMSVGLMALSAFVDVMEVDEFHHNKENIYRIITRVDDKQNKNTLASSSVPLANQLKYDGSGIEEMVMINRDFGGEVEINRSLIPVFGYYVTDNFFRVFDFELASGNPTTALKNPFSVVITEAAAAKFFGTRDPIGMTFPIKDLGDFVVTGVLKEYPRTHLYFEALASFSTLESIQNQETLSSLSDWGPRTNFYTYLLLQPGISPDELSTLANNIVTNQFAEHDELKATAELQPLLDIRTTDYYNEVGLIWGYATMTGFFVIALLVLLPACFNYSNISIARAIKRAKEIGLRKVSGGQSRNIFFQMILETVILSVAALAGGIIIFLLIRKEFLSMIIAGPQTFDLEITPVTFSVFLVFSIVTGVLAGIFPASYFARLSPIDTLRNTSLSGKLSKISIRKGLIVFQFAMSLVFILGVVIVTKQYKYALNYDLGFQKKNIIEIPLQQVNIDLLRTELERLPDVESISMSSSAPGGWSNSSSWVRLTPESDSVEVSQLFTDSHFLDCLEIELIAGKNFLKEPEQNRDIVIVNETFTQEFGFATPIDAVGQSVVIHKDEYVTIVGVVKDFNHQPLREKINPFFFRYDTDRFLLANVKISSNDIVKTLFGIEKVWETVSPESRFDFYFLDDKVEQSLIGLLTLIKIFGFLAMLAIVISCLGLLAVVLSVSEGRIKEMGLRKVMGASSFNLAYTLSRGFIKLIGIAILIATPFTYFLFEKVILRLQHYRSAIGIGDVLLGITILLVLLVITIGGQTMKVARVNPVETLKSE